MARTRTKAPAAPAPTPWWLMEGDEECPGCGHLYIYEMEFHCPDCEITTCIHCRRRHSDGRLVCVSCVDVTPGAGDAG
jgi:hypothetical protein